MHCVLCIVLQYVVFDNVLHTQWLQLHISKQKTVYLPNLDSTKELVE